MLKLPTTQQQWHVTSEEAGFKLLPFIKQKLGTAFSSRAIKQIIENNACLVNGRVERFASFLLNVDDFIVIKLPESQLPQKKQLSITSASILYEDDYLVAYNKSVGIASDDPRLLSAMLSHAPQSHLAHRLDRDTTGVLLFAKNQHALNKLFDLFRQHLITKTYCAIVDGCLTRSHGVIENYLGKIHAYQGQGIWGDVPSNKGLYAYTNWKKIKTGREATLLKCFPKTGRTHQIRVHLNSIHHPILGDYQYGRKFRCSYSPSRYLLHASEVEFIHPYTEKKLTITAPLPKDFLDALQTLQLT